ncbi:unnamed protein product [Arctogadus glacialis]
MENFTLRKHNHPGPHPTTLSISLRSLLAPCSLEVLLYKAEVWSDEGEEVCSDEGEEVCSDEGEEVWSDEGEEVWSDEGEEVWSDEGEE